MFIPSTLRPPCLVNRETPLPKAPVPDSMHLLLAAKLYNTACISAAPGEGKRLFLFFLFPLLFLSPAPLAHILHYD